MRTDPEDPGRLLVVDDNELNRDLLSRRLARRGHTVSVAEGGQQALDMIGGEPFDVVLLDIMMPGIDGIEVLTTVRQERSSSELPIIMATAKDETDDSVQALKLGTNDYVAKPLDFPVVLARVQTQLSLKRAREALVAAHARIKSNLDSAANVQQSLLPSAHPELEGVGFARRYIPCDELGGDLLNVVLLDDRHGAIHVLDVCAHGVDSLLLAVSMTHTLSRRLDPSSTITEAADSGEGFSIAPPAAVARHLSSLFPMTENGMLHGESSIGLSEGDRVYLYTDAALEERSPSGEQFGLERVSSVLAGSSSSSLDESIDALIDALRSWRAGAPFADDLSIIGLEMTGEAG